MKVKELTRDQINELKLFYMTELVNENKFAETFGLNYDEPCWADTADPGRLVSDQQIEEHFEGMDFENSDFFCTAN